MFVKCAHRLPAGSVVGAQPRMRRSPWPVVCDATCSGLFRCVYWAILLRTEFCKNFSPSHLCLEMSPSCSLALGLLLAQPSFPGKFSSAASSGLSSAACSLTFSVLTHSCVSCIISFWSSAHSEIFGPGRGSAVREQRLCGGPALSTPLAAHLHVEFGLWVSRSRSGSAPNSPPPPGPLHSPASLWCPVLPEQGPTPDIPL